ncbi:hypothetical protein [Paractinoplanes atraurantiacus]|uniref:Uncharacterized protein n=1 Tax=Paractinoplanes atraurantiacus TaxID=1036182 RepID=A0A285F4Z5_9ACTN|nr:hypothetical protein [Actinoplanes atraurantiacus]SNY06400.1 hypothetical protein SAMN05421748_101708 [Actinoplanes atraurantiacus]
MSDVESMPGHTQRITGPDRTGTAWAVVDSVGRFVDIGLRPGWWEALGPDGVAAGLIEALESARTKAALVPLLLRRGGPPQDRDEGVAAAGPGDSLDVARGRIAEAYRLIDEAGKRMREQQASRVIAGPRGLFRLHVRGGRIDRAETGPQRPGPGDTERLVADARDALTELARGRDGALDAWQR